jgi:hypothetical protein
MCAGVVRYAHTHNRTTLDRALLESIMVPDGRGGRAVGYNVDY